MKTLSNNVKEKKVKPCFHDIRLCIVWFPRHARDREAKQTTDNGNNAVYPRECEAVLVKQKKVLKMHKIQAQWLGTFNFRRCISVNKV